MSTAKQAANYTIDLRELLEAGCHFGHQSRRWNPKMKPFIFTQRDNVHIFDLAISAKNLTNAMNFVKEFVASGKDIVFVGTKRQAKQIVREEAKKLDAPFITERWLGGTITNWEEITRRINKLKDLKKGSESGKFDHYTKKEKVLLNREIARLERFFGGIADIPDRPSALFIVDANHEKTAVLEAVKYGIPVIAMIDSNGNPENIDYPIPVNDDAIRSIKLVVSKISQAYADGKAARKKAKVADKDAAKTASKPKPAAKK